MQTFTISNFSVTRDNKEVVHDVSLVANKGDVVFLMGPNGSGKSSLVNAVMGHPKYQRTSGMVMLDGEDITALPVDEKSRKGLFLSMQQQAEIPGITVSGMLRAAMSAHRGSSIPPLEFHKLLMQKMGELGIDSSFANRQLGTGFSGGEKKRLEMLQLMMLTPKYALLDETEAGLDADAVKLIGETIAKLRATTGFVIITHNPAVLGSVIPDRVYIMKDGVVAEEGGKELADRVSTEGYGFLSGVSETKN